jgi:hypothetical protein
MTVLYFSVKKKFIKRRISEEQIERNFFLAVRRGK